MISPFARCTEYYLHHKITVVASPVGASGDGVKIVLYVYNPSVSSVDPIFTSSDVYPAFESMDSFNDLVHDIILSAYPTIEAYVVPSNTSQSSDIPDPLQQELYYSSTFNNNLSPTSPRAVGKSGSLIAPESIITPTDVNSVTGRDVSGAPGYPQVTHPSVIGKPYYTQPFSGSPYVSDTEIKAQRPDNTNNTKRHK